MATRLDKLSENARTLFTAIQTKIQDEPEAVGAILGGVLGLAAAHSIQTKDKRPSEYAMGALGGGVLGYLAPKLFQDYSIDTKDAALPGAGAGKNSPSVSEDLGVGDDSAISMGLNTAVKTKDLAGEAVESAVDFSIKDMAKFSDRLKRLHPTSGIEYSTNPMDRNDVTSTVRLSPGIKTSGMTKKTPLNMVLTSLMLMKHQRTLKSKGFAPLYTNEEIDSLKARAKSKGIPFTAENIMPYKSEGGSKLSWPYSK